MANRSGRHARALPATRGRPGTIRFPAGAGVAAVASGQAQFQPLPLNTQAGHSSGDSAPGARWVCVTKPVAAMLR